jgi:5-methylcytosine-specific restriction endonuclease McrA
MAIDYSQLAIPKPEPSKTVKARAKRLWAKARAKAREIRWTRDGGCCVRCGKPVKLHWSEAEWWNVANIHETRPRSLGGDPLNPDEQETLCADCHKKRHGLR